MTLIEAILNSNSRPFKLPQMTSYLYVKANRAPNEDFLIWTDNNTKCGGITITALISDQWQYMAVPDNVLKFPIKPIPPNRPDTAS